MQNLKLLLLILFIRYSALQYTFVADRSAHGVISKAHMSFHPDTYKIVSSSDFGDFSILEATPTAITQLHNDPLLTNLGYSIGLSGTNLFLFADLTQIHFQ